MFSYETVTLAAVHTVLEGVGAGGQGPMCTALPFFSKSNPEREQATVPVTLCASAIREVRAEVRKQGKPPLNKAT